MKYSLSSSGWDSNEIEAINHVIKSDRFTMGKQVQKFEKKIAEFHNCKHAVMLNSGSSANLVAATAITLKNKVIKINFLKKGELFWLQQ